MKEDELERRHVDEIFPKTEIEDMTECGVRLVSPGPNPSMGRFPKEPIF
jgi:hypothetical protein